MKYDGEELDDMSVMLPPSRFHCTLLLVPAYEMVGCWPEAEPPTLTLLAEMPGAMFMMTHGSRAVGTFAKMSAGERAAGRRLLRVHGRRSRRDGHFLLHAADLHLRRRSGAANPVVMMMFCLTNFLKLAELERHRVRADRHLRERVRSRRRRRLATNGCCRPVPVTVTVTPGSTAPLASVTTPKICPSAWARAVPASASSTNADSKILRKTRIDLSPFFWTALSRTDR